MMPVASSSRLLLPRQACILARQPLRSFATTSRRLRLPNNSDDGGDGFSRPGPPPLPPKEQREFERLIREKQNAPQFKPASLVNNDKHPQYRAKPVPEFDGEVNPDTGEVGGPKNDPLRWEREWTYGGRSTDF